MAGGASERLAVGRTRHGGLDAAAQGSTEPRAANTGGRRTAREGRAGAYRQAALMASSLAPGGY